MASLPHVAGQLHSVISCVHKYNGRSDVHLRVDIIKERGLLLLSTHDVELFQLLYCEIFSLLLQSDLVGFFYYSYNFLLDGLGHCG